MPAAAVIHEWQALFIFSARIKCEGGVLIILYLLYCIKYPGKNVMTVVYIN